MTSEKMDEELRNATLRGDVDFLKKCVVFNKPIEYYLAFFSLEYDQSEKQHHGNIFHLAAMENREEFIREAMRILPLEAKQQLLLQPGNEVTKWNPLHKAAKVGNIEIVKIFLEVYRCLPTLPSDLSKRPWLQETYDGYTPCHVAVSNNHEQCALEILKMDMECICNVITIASNSLVCEAIHRKMSKLALEVLKSSHSINCREYDGSTPFHLLHLIEGLEGSEEIFRHLLQREPKLIERKTISSRNSAFHSWSYSGKMWPFKILLESNDIIPDVNVIFRDLVSSANMYGDNPLHTLAEYTPCEEDAKKIAKLLIDIYKNSSSSSLSNNLHPWLVQNCHQDTPLSLAIIHKNEKLANYILSVDYGNTVIKCEKNVLFLAIENECHEVAEEILKIVDKKGWTQLLANDQKLNVLHLAPLCTESFCAQLIDGHPELIKGVNREGFTIVHSWIKSDQEWLFKFILETKWKVSFVKLIDAKDYNDLNNPFHVATTHKATMYIVRLLVEAYKENFLDWELFEINQFPWFEKNKENEGPLLLSLRNKREDLALYILSLFRDDRIDTLLDYYEPEHSTLFLAVQNNCSQVAKIILKKLDKAQRTKYVTNSSNGQNILHLATSLTDEEFGAWLVDEASELIIEQDNNEQSPWDTAFEVGSSWFINVVLKKDPSVFNRAPMAWIKACEKGDVSTLCAFINHNPGAFRDLCIQHKDSPLHHIQLPSLTEYEEFLKVPYMKDLINLQDSKGATPLHIALQNHKRFLTETLLNMEKIDYNIKDKDQKSAIDLMAEVCNNDNTWEKMFQRIGFDPRIKTSYFQRKTNLLEVRSSLFVVAALLATITFTVGFTLPGGLKQETGEALLAKKVVFLMFLMSNTLALCTSMLVLICLVWSMVHQDSSKSLILIDRSMVLLMVAFYSTILAFMTGVYTVISPKVLWAAVIIIIMCSLIVISANKTLLYKVLLISPAKKKQNQRDSMSLLESGQSITCYESCGSRQKVE